jgi:hypothetical protein
MAGFLIAAGVVIDLIFLRRRSQTRAVSERPSSDEGMRGVRDTLTSTVDETQVSYHNSFTYDDLPSAINTVFPSTVTGE